MLTVMRHQLNQAAKPRRIHRYPVKVHECKSDVNASQKDNDNGCYVVQNAHCGSEFDELRDHLIGIELGRFRNSKLLLPVNRFRGSIGPLSVLIIEQINVPRFSFFLKTEYRNEIADQNRILPRRVTFSWFCGNAIPE